MMKKRNTSTLLVILAVLVVGVVVMKFTGDTGRSKSLREVLLDFENDAVTEVTITSQSDTVRLLKKEGEWSVNGGWHADKQTVETLFSNLKAIKPSRLVARTEDKWKDYQVNEQGTRVALRAGSKDLGDIVIGRFNVEGQRSFSTFVRLSEEADIYSAKDFMGMTITSRAVDFRLDDVVKLKRDSVARIAFNYPDSGFVMERVNGKWQSGEVQLDSAKAAQYLSGLSFVTSKKFTDRPQGSAAYDVTYYLTNGTEVVVQGFGEYQFMSSANPYEAWKDEEVHEKVFRNLSSFQPTLSIDNVDSPKP